MTKLSLADRCLIAAIYSSFKSDFIFDLLEPSLVNQIGEMTDTDVVHALIGYTNPNLKGKYMLMHDLGEVFER